MILYLETAELQLFITYLYMVSINCYNIIINIIVINPKIE